MKRVLLLVLLSAAIAGCGRSYREEKKDNASARENLLKANKAVVHDEARMMQDFIDRHGWKMQMTGTGLHYEIYQQGKGKPADANAVLSVAYKVFLLDGTLCYEASEQKPEQLVAGRGLQINGLEEGLMLMNEGARARFVIPHHLAYGLTGDQQKIPPASPLFYDVHLLKINRNPTP